MRFAETSRVFKDLKLVQSLGMNFNELAEKSNCSKTGKASTGMLGNSSRFNPDEMIFLALEMCDQRDSACCCSSFASEEGPDEIAFDSEDVERGEVEAEGSLLALEDESCWSAIPISCQKDAFKTCSVSPSILKGTDGESIFEGMDEVRREVNEGFPGVKFDPTEGARLTSLKVPFDSETV